MTDASNGNEQEPRALPDDGLEEKLVEEETVTNDAVTGETILSGPGEGNDGPTGGSEREATPVYDEHDPQTEDDVDLGDEED